MARDFAELYPGVVRNGSLAATLQAAAAGAGIPLDVVADKNHPLYYAAVMGASPGLLHR